MGWAAMGENPLFLIWYRTREVIEEKLEDTSKEQIILLIAVFGIALMLNNAAARGLGDHYSLGTILLYSIIFGPLMGALAWVILSGLLHWISRLLGGTGTWKETRTAVAWSTVVYSAMLVLWIPQLLLFGQELFTTETPRIDSNLLLLTLIFLFGLLETALRVMFVIVLSKSLGAAHRFSAWRGFGALALPIAALIILLALLIFLS